MTVTIVGVDCATQPGHTGLTWARAQGEKLEVLEARCASKAKPASSIVSDWVRDSKRALLALDAPLGWPVALGPALARHEAGEPLAAMPDEMFRRMTDDLSYKRLGKRPLEVGANWIARTAHAALRFLEELRESLSSPIPLAWSPKWTDRFAAIEVYPAATRISLGVPAGRGSLRGLQSHVRFRSRSPPKSEHARDAVVCAIAGFEFLSGRAVAPTRQQLGKAQREGWIWVGTAPGIR